MSEQQSEQNEKRTEGGTGDQLPEGTKGQGKQGESSQGYPSGGAPSTDTSTPDPS